MIVTKNWIAKNYAKFNELYFNGSLPRIQFVVNRSKHSWGMAYFNYDFPNDTIIPTKIAISNYYDSPEDVKIQTLLHEMIHIADYFWHPEHFIKNHKKVSKRYYDAHGYWFKEEAKRLTKESGYKIANHVTREEMNASSLSERSKENLRRKENNALICAVTGDNGVIFYFKTDFYKVDYLKKTLPTIIWYRFKNIKSVKFYTFDSPRYAAMRSCETRLRGWHTNRMGLLTFLENIKATEVYV